MQEGDDEYGEVEEYVQLYVGLAEEKFQALYGGKKERREKRPGEVKRRSRDDVCKRCVAGGGRGAIVTVGRRSVNLARMEGLAVGWMDGMHKRQKASEGKNKSQRHTQSERR